MNDKLRLRFEKTGKAAYISHLDLMRVMQRAFSRAGYKLKYSEGFNPHAILSICLPLSVGCSSLCELMDFRIVGDEDAALMPERLTRVMPEGIRATAAYGEARRITELKWLEVSSRLDYDERDAATAAEGLNTFFSAPEIITLRRTKRGEDLFDLAPHIKSFSAETTGGSVLARAVISAQEPTVNPELLVAALRRNAEGLAPDFAAFTRVETFDKDMEIFR